MRFIKGMSLCRAFCLEVVEPLLLETFPALPHSLGLLGYGSDVLGYDDEVSTDHMWGPRCLLFLRSADMGIRDDLHDLFCKRFPTAFMGYSVNFSDQNPSDGGIRTAVPIEQGPVSPLYWVHTPEAFLLEHLGKLPANAFDWLALSEHRLLGLASGQLYVDTLAFQDTLDKYARYPDDVRRYLVTSQWALISEERAFAKRCASVGDDTGSRLVCARIAERLMRLCFLYAGIYAPYSKWFGTAFSELPVPEELHAALACVLSANAIAERESSLVRAQVLVAELHNASGLTEPLPIRVQPYFDRDIQVINTDAFSESTRATISDPLLRAAPRIGTFSQIGNFVHLTDSPHLVETISDFHRQVARLSLDGGT